MTNLFPSIQFKSLTAQNLTSLEKRVVFLNVFVFSLVQHVCSLISWGNHLSVEAHLMSLSPPAWIH